MSLDVYLSIPGCQSPTRQVIFVREDGQTKEISREEWDRLYPGREPVTVDTTDEVYSANITHNLTDMADAAGIYKVLWRPEGIGITKARQLIEPLSAGLAALEKFPVKFRAYNPPNGWGTYEGLVRFVREYLSACKEYPHADVRASR